MEVEICSPHTLRCYPGLEEQLRIWAELSSISVDDLLVRILCGSLLDEYCDLLIWHLDPRDLTKGMPKIVGHYRPPGLIELDVVVDRPRWGLLALYFFHELGHHKSCLEQSEVTECDADAFARRMMKACKEHCLIPRRLNKMDPLV